MSQVVVPFQKCFPLEVLLLVFEQADRSTLAALGAVSMDTLELTSRLLYRDVVVTSLEQLQMLFCERKQETTSLPSRINHFLVLSSVRTLFVGFVSIYFTPFSLHLPHSRIASSSTLSLDNLVISSPYKMTWTIQLLREALLPLLNPIRLEYDIQGAGKEILDSLGGSPLLFNFTRLEELYVKGLLFFHNTTLPEARNLASLPPPTLDRRRTIRIDIASFLSKSCKNAARFIYRLPVESPYGIFSTEPMQDGSIIFVVRTEEEREEGEAAILKEMEEPEWRGRFAVEVERKD